MRYPLFSRAACLLSLGLSSGVPHASDLVTHLFPHRDGEVAPNTGGNRDSVLKVGLSGALGWITYQTGGADLTLTTGSVLTLHVDSIYSSGTLKIYALDQAVAPPEADVEDVDLDFDDMSPVATLAMTGADQGKVVRLDLDDLLSGGTFHGLVLEAASGLRVDFDSKDSDLQPLIELQYAFATPEQIDAAIQAAQDATYAADAAAASATAAAASATSASSSASAAATSATSASSSATSAASSATSAAASAAAAETWADSALTLISMPGQIVLTTNAEPFTGFSYSGQRRVMEKPWSAKAGSSNSRYAVSGVAYDGKLWVSGGYNGSFLATFEYYNPATNSWTARASLGQVTHRHGMAEVGGYLYAIGGQSGTTILSTNVQYHPGTNAWTAKQSMPAAKGSLAVVACGGKIYAIGGSSTNNHTGVVATNYAYDPSTDTWATKAALPTGRMNISAVVYDGKIHALGGYLGSNSATTSHDVYDPATDTWSSAAAVPVAMESGGAVVVNGKIHYLQNSSHYQYDPGTDTWVQLQAPNSPRSDFAIGNINGATYISHGYSGGHTASIEAYPDPLSAYYHVRD